MRRQRKAKIIATLGPSSSDYEKIKALFVAGADVFRLNFSHGEHAEHAEPRTLTIAYSSRPDGLRTLDYSG